MVGQSNNPEISPWLKTLPLAPEFHPTIKEFQDPISYIFKIEKQASRFGICKIIPPLPPQSKKSLLQNFNLSVSDINPTSQPPTFTTRHQQIGFCTRKQTPIKKSVWQSGQNYTLQEFETKAKNFERSFLKNRGIFKKTVLPLEVETLFWKANGDKPFSVEYANDMPGSGFVDLKKVKKNGLNVGDSAWNMRGVARANGSLLRFMKEEIPGVTSPMVYAAMMFSWFAWHVEDHDLHSLNYLHYGASKTWYGVPRDAALAFEEVVRVYGFGEEINPLVTFATLGEKNTVMSPEVLINAGVPCCRLVQNAGEFVITFPRAYHSGFSHGFNCGEASNIATPEWLRFAKDAAIRRASINYPPMVSHFQLLYDLALAICVREPMTSGAELRSSRLKEKKKGEGEILVKQMFVQDVMQNNELLFTLGQGFEVVLLPHNSSEKFVWSNLRVGSKYKGKPGLPYGLNCSEEAIKASDDIMLNKDVAQTQPFYSVKGKVTPRSKKSGALSQSSSDSMCILPHETHHSDTEKGGAAGDGLSERGLFSCVKCGIWTFACVAIVQPTESSAQYLMSADCSVFNDWVSGSGVSSHGVNVTDGDAIHSDPDSSFSGSMEKTAPNGLYDMPVQSPDYEVQNTDYTSTMKSENSETKKDSSALGLLAMTYGNSSDSDENDELPDCPTISDDNLSGDGSCGDRFHHDSVSPTSQQGYDSGIERGPSLSECRAEDFPQRFDLYGDCHHIRANSDDSESEDHDCSTKFAEEETMNSDLAYSPTIDENDTLKISHAIDPVSKASFPFVRGCDEDSSRMHVFCLEHALEVDKQLRPIGGVHILLLCHPDYPKVHIEAKKLAEELEMDYVWKDIAFSEATREDEERIQLALQSEDTTPKNGDWAVKLGINLFYSAVLSRSPLYNKQMPYNSVIYSAFGCDSPSKSSPEVDFFGKGAGRQKKIVVAGKWCGKVWMSNHVHPLLVQRDPEDEQITSRGTPKTLELSATSLETNKKVQTNSTCKKIGTKRKPRSVTRAVKKMKFEVTDFADTDPEDFVDDDKPYFEPSGSNRKPKTQGGSIRKVKPQEEEIPESGSEEDLLENVCHQRPWRSARTLRKAAKGKRSQKMKGQPKVNLDCYSDESFDEVSHSGQRTRKRSVKAENKPTRTLKGRQQQMLGSESDSQNEDSEDKLVRSPQFDPVSDDDMESVPTTRLRRRTRKLSSEIETKPSSKKRVPNSKEKKAQTARKGPKMRLPVRKCPVVSDDGSQEEEEEDEEEAEAEGEFVCDIEGCNMSLRSKQELSMHKRNICPVKGCDKKFFSHKYLVQHRRVHMDDRPLSCPWKGCRMTFKWAWARTEHIRVHTGARPYICNEPGCGQTFRFVSDFSRHKRKTGHSAKKTRKG